MPMPRRPLTGPDDPRHGTPNAYSRHGCRCSRCRAATADTARRRYREKEARPRKDLSDEEKRHAARVRRERWRAENLERERNVHRAYRLSPRGSAAFKAAKHRRRAREQERECGCASSERMTTVWVLDSGRCAYCNAPGTDYEHVVPLARGGWGCVSNFRVACKSCNSRKGTKPLSVFLEHLASAGVEVRPGATNSGLPCPAAAERMARRALTA